MRGYEGGVLSQKGKESILRVKPNDAIRTGSGKITRSFVTGWEPILRGCEDRSHSMTNSQVDARAMRRTSYDL